jgi:hypothetical protein
MRARRRPGTVAVSELERTSAFYERSFAMPRTRGRARWPPQVPRDSIKVGTSGSNSDRVAVVTASARSLPALIYSIDETVAGKHDLHLPPEQIGEGGPATTIGHMHHLDPSHHLEELARDMIRGPIARRRQC